MDLCLAAERCPGSRIPNQWWDQEGLDLEGVWTASGEVEEEEGEEETDSMETDTDK